MCDIDIVKTCMRSTLNTSTRTGRPEALPDPEGGSSGTSASAAATFIIERITWLRISASLVLIFRLIDSRASKHSSCKYKIQMMITCIGRIGYRCCTLSTYLFTVKQFRSQIALLAVFVKFVHHSLEYNIFI